MAVIIKNRKLSIEFDLDNKADRKTLASIAQVLERAGRKAESDLIRAQAENPPPEIDPGG